MTNEMAELKRRLVVGRKSDGRCRYDEQAKSELVALCLQPGAPVSRLAREFDLNANQLTRGLREHGHGARPRTAAPRTVPTPSAFVAVPVVASAAAPEPGKMLTVLHLQARLPNGVSVDLRGVDAGHMSAVIEALGSAAVFRLDEGLKVYLHRAPVYFRLNINGLAALVQQALGLNPFAAFVYVFSNRRRDRVKVLGWDRNGFWLLLKRLEQDRFIWPSEQDMPTLEQVQALQQALAEARAHNEIVGRRTAHDHWGAAHRAHRARPTQGAAQQVQAPAVCRQQRGHRPAPEGHVLQRGRESGCAG
jgi:transposase-like protein/transposase